MEIQEKDVMAAYKEADENGKAVFKKLFPTVSFDEQKSDSRPVTERIKSFDDAINALGEDNQFVIMFRNIDNNYAYTPKTASMIAYAKLQVICAALNEGWEPQFTEDEYRWYPWFWLYTQDEIDSWSEERKNERVILSTGDYVTDFAGFVFASSHRAPSRTYSDFGSRLCFKSSELATYCGKQFINLWADFHLIHK